MIESKQGGKAFSQLYAALALRHFGTDLAHNLVWQSLTPAEKDAWRSLLDPSRFYDRKTRHVINLPENYFGVAARVVTMDYQMGFIEDRVFVDDVLDRAAEQFTQGNLYSDDGLPTGRYDRYSNEYIRYVYEAADNIGRKDVMAKLEPSLHAQMKTWWDLLSPDGYGYPWGRSLGVISYIDTIEIVGFVSRYPQFRPAPLPQLASAYYNAWTWLVRDYMPERHLLNVLGFGHGNYSYINPTREWQQTTAFFGKVAGAHFYFTKAMEQEKITEISTKIGLPDVTRFEYFRKGERTAGVWLVRKSGIRFALPITSGTRPGISDYLPVPYNLPGFAPPVEQSTPTITSYIEMQDGKVYVACDGADFIEPSTDGQNLHAKWTRWAQLGTKAGELSEIELNTDVVWRLDGNALVRTETITTKKPVQIKRIWVIVPSTADRVSTIHENRKRVDRFSSADGVLDVSITKSNIPFDIEIHATGDSAMGKGSRNAIPLYLDFQAKSVTITPEKPLQWAIVLSAR